MTDEPLSDDAIIERILSHARRGRPEELLETTMMTLEPDFYEAASLAFGGWDAALVAALSRALDKGGARSTSRRSASVDAVEQVDRKVGEAAGHPIYCITDQADFYEVDPEAVPVTDAPIIAPRPPSVTRLHHLAYLGEPNGMIVFTTAGRYFGLDPRMVPKFDGEMLNRQIQQVIHLDGGERVMAALPRRLFYGGRLIHLTRQGKTKASDISDIGYTLDRTGREAFLLGDDDEPVAVMAGPEDTSVFCASAMGKAIHFPADELRSMGLKAVGVNAMKLEDDDDAVVGGFLGHDVSQVAVITAAGMGKRVEFDEFRPQGRAGAGLQLLRLDGDDRVAAVVACEAAGDLVVTTTRGRLHRMPATDFARMGRPAKGNQMIELFDDERVLGLSALPVGSE